MKNRITTLQVVRALAFFGVFTSHTNIKCFLSGGVWGVSVFFVLSGFLMVYSYYDSDRVKNANCITCIRFGVPKIRKLQ